MEEDLGIPSKKKNRSKLYPRYDLEKSIELLKKLKELGKNTSTKSLATAMDIPFRSSAFLGRISSARQFGLIETEQGLIRASEIGMKFLYPTNETTVSNSLMLAFQKPDLYQGLIRAFEGTYLPNEGLLENRLVHDFGIEANAKRIAAKNFIGSARTAGAVQNGILVIQDTAEDQADESLRPTLSMSNVKQAHKNKTFTFPGPISLTVPDTTRVDSLITDGELKEVKNAIERFAKKIGDPSGIDETPSQ